MKKSLTSFAIFLMLGIGTVRAQDQQSAPPEDQSRANTGDSDQGGPDVARLSYIHGKVSTQRGDNGEWVGVTLNTPIMPGDRVSTGDDSKAELQLDWANVIRLGNNATVKVANLTRTNVQVQVGRGLVTYSLLSGENATAEVDTPNAALHPSGAGEYRMLVNSDSESIIVARQGGADISTPQGSAHINEGQMITIEGTDNPQYKIDPAPAGDDWDTWNRDRDHIISKAEQSTNANRYEVGTQDLDAYGRWQNVPDYGQVWVPNQDSGWAPYREGQWVWEPYYGWTWVSYEPWGWAPYHYGRWFVYNGAWAWWPGPVYAGYYPVWAPAYVSFFGWGGGWGFGFGFGFGFGWGHVGWLPVGPFDWYHPWWGRWGLGWRGVAWSDVNRFHEGWAPLGPHNGLHYSNVDMAMRNDRVRAGFSSMEGRDFGRTSVPVHQGLIGAETLRNASLSTGKMPITPGHESYSATGRAADPASYRHAPANSQHFFTASRPGGTSNFASRANTANGFGSRGNLNSPSRPANSSRPATTTNGANRNAGAITSSRPGFHTFTPPSTGGANSFERPSSTMNGRSDTMTNANRSGSSIASSRPGFHTFTPPSSSSAGRAYSNGYSYGGRPSLNMRQPIVTPRNNGGYGSYGGRGYGGYSSPPYGAPRSYSAPRSPSAPRSYSAPRGGSYHGGGTRGSHSSGGGHPSGGGGHGHGR